MPVTTASETIAIRDAAPDDAAAIAGIYADAVAGGTASFELEAPDAAEIARRMAELAARGFPWLVAEKQGEIAGYAYASSYRSRPAYDFTVEDSVYVATVHKRAGVGRALLKALIAACEARGYRQMIAVITDEAADGSIALHEACGFVHAGRLNAVGWKHGRWLATLFMQRQLGAGHTTAPPER